MTTPVLMILAFFAIELAALQRVLGSREHAFLCLIAAAGLVALAMSRTWGWP